MWDIEIKRHAVDEPSAHVIARVNHPGTIHDVTLEGGQGVHSTTAGGASRGRMAEWDNPVQAVFRWPDDLVSPRAFLRWTDADGDIHEEAIDLGSHQPGTI